jgi:hypothetical protein
MSKTLRKIQAGKTIGRRAECQAWIFSSAGDGDGKITEPPF